MNNPFHIEWGQIKLNMQRACLGIIVGAEGQGHTQTHNMTFSLVRHHCSSKDTDTAPVKQIPDLDEKDLPGYTDIHFLPKPERV